MVSIRMLDNSINFQSELGKYMMVNFTKDHDRLLCSSAYEILQIEPWGRDSVRVRATRLNTIKSDWISALLNPEKLESEIEIHERGASLRSGAMIVNVNSKGELTFTNANTGRELLKEKPIHALSIPARYYKEDRKS